jgi:D-sedoheptulose 7-phosphate isomerase
VDLIEEVRKAPRIYIIGNGGSYANAIHICNDLLLCGKAAFTLDPATLTASANDFGYSTVFERWLSVVGERGDLLIALSGSGKSENILRGIAAAEKKGMSIWLETDYLRTYDMQASEERQLLMGHNLMRALRASK